MKPLNAAKTINCFISCKNIVKTKDNYIEPSIFFCFEKIPKKNMKQLNIQFFCSIKFREMKEMNGIIFCCCASFFSQYGNCRKILSHTFFAEISWKRWLLVVILVWRFFFQWQKIFRFSHCFFFFKNSVKTKHALQLIFFFLKKFREIKEKKRIRLAFAFAYFPFSFISSIQIGLLVLPNWVSFNVEKKKIYFCFCSVCLFWTLLPHIWQTSVLSKYFLDIFMNTLL